MSDDIEYIEPTQEHVGQMVEVKSGNSWEPRRLLAVLPISQAVRFVCQNKTYERDFAAWKNARIPRPLTYAERQAKCGLKVGDRVKFVRAWDDGESGTHLEFYNEMRPTIDQAGVVTDIKKSIRVEFGSVYWWLPYFVLEKVEDRRATNKDFGKIIYVYGNPADEFKMEMAYQVDGEPYRAVVRSGDKRFVYELSNLRVKE